MILIELTAFARHHNLVLHFDFEDLAPWHQEDWEKDFALWLTKDKSRRADHRSFPSDNNGSLVLVPGQHGKAMKTTIDLLSSYGKYWDDNDIASDAISVLAWIRIEKGGSISPLMVDGSNSQPVIRATITGGSPFYLQVWNDNGKIISFINHGIAVVDEWIHYAATFDGFSGWAILYINGKEESRVAANEPISRDWGNRDQHRVIISLRPDKSRAESAAIIDDINVWTRALSSDEVQAIMRNGVPLTVSSSGRLPVRWGLLKSRE